MAGSTSGEAGSACLAYGSVSFGVRFLQWEASIGRLQMQEAKLLPPPPRVEVAQPCSGGGGSRAGHRSADPLPGATRGPGAMDPAPPWPGRIWSLVHGRLREARRRESAVTRSWRRHGAAATGGHGGTSRGAAARHPGGGAATRAWWL
ncbi:hypothetical protein SEVIR_7G131450v4 [Setaria viridis]